MIKYSDNARDYIERGNKARAYLYRNRKQKVQKQSKVASTITLWTFIIVIGLMVASTIPQAIDDMLDRNEHPYIIKNDN